MAVNDEYIDKQGRPRGGVSSQAGLNAFAGGRAKSLPSVPAPGQPGSRFNAVVVDRGERMSREEGVKAPRGTKTLPVNMPPGMIQGIPAAIMEGGRDDQSEPTVAEAATRGFASGFLGAVQNRFLAATGRGPREQANPSWRANNQAAVELNAKIMAASAQTIALLDREIQTTTEPEDAGYRLQMIAARAQAADGLKAMQESMAHDQVNVDLEAGAHTEADVEALRQQLSQLHAANDQMRELQQQHGVPQRLGGPSVGNRLRSKSPDPTLAGTFDQGFASGYMSLGQSRLYGDSVPGHRDENPNWKENTEKAAAVNRAFMDSSADTLALLDKDIDSMADPSDYVDRAELEETHAEVAGARDTVEELMAEDQEHAGAQAWGWTDAELEAQQRLVGELGKIDQRMAGMREQRRLKSPDAARQPAAEPSSRRSAPVRNADGMTLADLTAMAPGEDPLPGMSQPLIMDVLNEVQGIPPQRPAAGGAKRSARSAVMAADHVAALKELDRGDDGLEMAGSIYGR